MELKDRSNVEDNSNKSNRAKKQRIRRGSIETLEIKCKWRNCDIGTLSKYNFYKHISSHVRDLEIRSNEKNEEYYACLWCDCNYTSEDNNEITRHVKYHGYISGLKGLGVCVSQTMQLPPCLIPSEYHVPENVVDAPYVCSWDDCGECSSGIQEFIVHVHDHVRCIPESQAMNCLWTECESEFSKKSKLLDHIKTHTKEHYIACPHCGQTFANKTKFADHCLAQKPLEEHRFQCDYCLSLHPTERILRKHMLQHIHHYKCPFCNMTCNKPSLLCRHIRYRHLDYKFFKCSSCNFQCKSKNDLQSHLLSHVKGLHSCQEPGCNFLSPTPTSMRRHYEQTHTGRQLGPFVCHLCEKKFTRGAYLTKHLASQHNIKKPPGYSRFQYKLDEDGNRRLQTVRLESLDVDEMLDYEVQEEGADTNEEDVDDPLRIEPSTEERSKLVRMETPSSSKAITVDVLGEKGQILSSAVVVPEESLLPPEAEIIAIGT